jgi:O-acetyl-ADP-ribose deacetylase (regulator of RNase III)
MITSLRGNLIEADAEALVNSVNTVGVMGKGIALQFRQAFPENYRQYASACKLGLVNPGEMFVVRTGKLTNPKFIINFPTKRHWKHNSRMSDIESGLVDLVAQVRQLELRSIALPPLGCGNGGLDWTEVRPRIVKAFEGLPHIQVQLFEPVGAPNPDNMPVATTRPRMTAGRAALVGALYGYLKPGYRLTLLEINKLMYFLQQSGENLGLKFAKDKYGPYAENLNHVLQRVEGHYVRGYGDRTNRGTQIGLYEDAVSEAVKFLKGKPETRERLARVSDLIEGFETPYGLELLATVHWVAAFEDMLARSDSEHAIRGVQAWSKRKREQFEPRHIRKAWDRLRDQDWI